MICICGGKISATGWFSEGPAVYAVFECDNCFREWRPEPPITKGEWLRQPTSDTGA